MKWLLQLYPARWRDRYGEEFDAVLASQRTSVGMVLDVLGGAIDAHLYPQIQNPNSKPIKEEDTMTILMLQRCSAGGPKLSPRDQRIASLFMILSALVMAVLYIALTKIYHSAPAVQAVGFASFPALCLVYGEAAYLRKRPWLTQVFILVGGLSGMYLFMLAVSVIGSRFY
jgi:hypothetical protein